MATKIVNLDDKPRRVFAESLIVQRQQLEAATGATVPHLPTVVTLGITLMFSLQSPVRFAALRDSIMLSFVHNLRVNTCAVTGVGCKV